MLHARLKDAIDHHFADRLVAPVQLARDALIVRLANGVLLELRQASAEEYALNWRCGDTQLRIDTAPVHPDLASFPNHLHAADGSVRADPLTHPGHDPWENVRDLLEALCVDPLLQSSY